MYEITTQKPIRMSLEEARFTGHVLSSLRVLLNYFKAGVIDPNDPVITEIKTVAAELHATQPSIQF